MKLQLTPQAIRLRLDDEELAHFNQSGQLTQVLALGPGRPFTYALERLPAEAAAATPQARYTADTLTVEISAAQARQLVAGEVVSLRGEVAGAGGQPLRVLVEKDLGPSH